MRNRVDIYAVLICNQYCDLGGLGEKKSPHIGCHQKALVVPALLGARVHLPSPSCIS